MNVLSEISISDFSHSLDQACHFALQKTASRLLSKGEMRRLTGPDSPLIYQTARDTMKMRGGTAPHPARLASLPITPLRNPRTRPRSRSRAAQRPGKRAACRRRPSPESSSTNSSRTSNLSTCSRMLPSEMAVMRQSRGSVLAAAYSALCREVQVKEHLL
jgi:hypothetical protein